MKGINPNRCPNCGNTNTLREIGKRVTWQPVRLAWVSDELSIGDYHEWQYGDDPLIDCYDCVDCGTEWPTINALQVAMISNPFPRHAGENLLYTTLVDRGHRAEDVIKAIRDNEADLWSEFFGPAVDAAARDIGLQPTPVGE